MASEFVWTDGLYDFSQHLYWEPQHLNRQKTGDSRSWAELEAALRRAEVPLEGSFKVFLGILRPELRNAMLENVFNVGLGPGLHVTNHFGIEVEAPFSDYLQSDVGFATEQERGLLEMKLDSQFSVSQVSKYLVGMAYLEAQEGRLPAEPVLLHLSRDTNRCKWKPDDWTLAPADRCLNAAMMHLRDNPLPGSANKEKAWPFAERVAELAATVRTADGTWEQVARFTQDRLVDHETPEVAALARGFMQELASRGLVPDTPSPTPQKAPKAAV